MTKLKVSVTTLEFALGIGTLDARISSVAFNIADQCFYFEISGADVPEVDIVVTRTVQSKTVTLEPAQ